MSLFQITALTSLLATLGLGAAVYWSASHRRSNRAFLVLSLIVASWLLCLTCGSFSYRVETIMIWMRLAAVASLSIAMGFDFLRHSIIVVQQSSTRVWLRVMFWVVALSFVVFLVQTDFFLKGAVLPESPSAIAVPDYGPGFFAFSAVLLSCTGMVIYSLLRSMWSAIGVQRLELQFVVMGCAASIPVGVLVTVISKIFDIPEFLQFLPLCAIVLDAFIAYGVATRRIMGVSYVLQRMTSYVLLFALMVGGYGVCRGILHSVGNVFGFGEGGGQLAELGATLIVVFSVLPAHGWVNRIADHLFIGSAQASVYRARERAAGILQMVNRVDLLLAQIADVIESDMRSGQVRFYLRDEDSGAFFCQYPVDVSKDSMELSIDADHLLVQRVAREREPVVLHVLMRMSDAEADAGLIELMENMSVSLAVGIFSKEGLQGMMLLAPRESGRIYDAIEQRALFTIVRQLGVSLENAKLYTALQDGKLYTELIVDSLVSGLIAVDRTGSVTVINRRALEMSGLEDHNIHDLTLDMLPKPISEAFEGTLQNHMRIEDRDLLIQRNGDGDLPLRVTSTLFRGSEGDVRGALMLMNDLTDLRKLEGQVRRNDRLSSLGTLSAGMAHEIKNPLVAIKTFTQLLPERYADADFRETFFSLISHEVQRIDSIVNRLLGFARPATPSLVGTQLHSVIEESLQLISQQAKSCGVSIVRELHAASDAVNGDADLLKQAFVNFFLNAIEAMGRGGQLSVSTNVFDSSEPLVAGSTRSPKRLVVLIEDTGCGIEADRLQHIFDPFFTTKAAGTGLGLSVAHGILQEHQVSVDVESSVAEGTVFTLTFNVACEEEVVRT